MWLNDWNSSILLLCVSNQLVLSYVHVQGIPGRKGIPGQPGEDGRRGPPGDDVIKSTSRCNDLGFIMTIYCRVHLLLKARRVGLEPMADRDFLEMM